MEENGIKWNKNPMDVRIVLCGRGDRFMWKGVLLYMERGIVLCGKGYLVSIGDSFFLCGDFRKYLYMERRKEVLHCFNNMEYYIQERSTNIGGQ